MIFLIGLVLAAVFAAVCDKALKKHAEIYRFGDYCCSCDHLHICKCDRFFSCMVFDMDLASVCPKRVCHISFCHRHAYRSAAKRLCSHEKADAYPW